MKIFAIDPGTTKSAWLYMEDGTIKTFGINENHQVVEIVRKLPADYRLVYEMFACYGMAVGAAVFETVLWTGRFVQAAPCEVRRLYRKDVKMHLCNSMRAKDGNVRQAIIDRYPASGGGKTPQIGIQSIPGPLYGVSKDVWSALALAITFKETVKQKGQ
jgi:hypothetical protein